MLPPAEVTTLLRDRLARIAADLAGREQLASTPQVQALPELFLIEFHYRIAMLEAERNFVAAMVQRLESGDFGGVEDWARLHEMLNAGLSRAEIAAEIAKYAATFTSEEAPDQDT
jgi:hypothetical protein